MAKQILYTTDTVPTAQSPEGTYAVKNASDAAVFDTYIVESGQVKKQDKNDTKIVQIASDLFPQPFISAGTGYWTGSAGNPLQINGSASYRYMNLVSIEPGRLITWDGFYRYVNSAMLCVLTDSNNNFVARINFSDSQNADPNTGHFEYTMPENAAKVGFIFNVDSANFPIANAKISIGDVSVKLKAELINVQKIESSFSLATTAKKGVTILSSVIDNNEDVSATPKMVFDFKNDIFEIGDGYQQPFISAGTGYWTGSAGNPLQINGSASYRYMNLVSIEPGRLITWDGFYRYVNSAMLCVLTDSNNNFVARINFSDSQNADPNTGHFEYTMPENAAKVGFIFNVDSANFPIANAKISIGDVSVKLKAELINVQAIKQELIKDDLPVIRVLASQSDMFQRGLASKIYTPTTKKKCIIVAGQSNTDGRVPAAQFPVSFVDESGQTVNYLENGQILNTMYCKNSLSANFGMWTLGTAQWAYDAIVLSRLQHHLNDIIYEIKWSLGSTAISPSGMNGGGFWTPRFENIPAGKQKLLSNFEQSIRTAITNNSNIEIKAFLWHQGEADYSPAARGDYYDNFCDVIDYVRGVVGNPTLPVIFGTISHSSGQYSSIIEDAMIKIANQDKYIYMIDMSNAALLDAYHFDATSSEYLGTKMYEVLRDEILI